MTCMCVCGWHWIEMHLSICAGNELIWSVSFPSLVLFGPWIITLIAKKTPLVLADIQRSESPFGAHRESERWRRLGWVVGWLMWIILSCQYERKVNAAGRMNERFGKQRDEDFGYAKTTWTCQTVSVFELVKTLENCCCLWPQGMNYTLTMTQELNW